MPVPNSFTYTSNWDVPSESSRTDGYKNHKSQNGLRWAPGDRKDQVLAYSSFTQRGQLIQRASIPTTQGYNPSETSLDPYYGITGGSTPESIFLGNRTYAKLVDTVLGESTQLGTFLAERKESYGMVANRVTGLYRAYKELRRGNFKKFLSELSVDPKRKHRSKTRSAAAEASGLWLEYWFGWSPTVNDLYGVSEVLAKHYISQRYHAVSGLPLPPLTRNVGGGTSYRRVTTSGKLLCKTGVTMKLVNPDVQVLQQMGLINPLSVAWELVPFSFVVDWFTKFGNVINATTDFVGFDQYDGYRTFFCTTTVDWSSGSINPVTWDRYRLRRWHMRRKLGIVTPKATLPRLINYGNSKTRAATAVSLLNQIFLAK